MNNDIKNKTEQVFKDHLEFLSHGKITEWVDLFAEDGKLEFPYATKGYPKEIMGKKSLYEYMKNFPENFKVEFKNLHFYPLSEPNTVIAEFESEGIALSTNYSYNQKYISIVMVNKDGKIVKYIDYWNPLIFMESLGIKIDEEVLFKKFEKQ